MSDNYGSNSILKSDEQEPVLNRRWNTIWFNRNFQRIPFHVQKIAFVLVLIVASKRNASIGLHSISTAIAVLIQTLGKIFIFFRP